MTLTPRFREFLAILLCVASAISLAGQATAPAGALRGLVTDPTGAVVPGAQITISLADWSASTRSGHDGAYMFRGIQAGSYKVKITAHGFEPLAVDHVVIVPGQTRELILPLAVAIEHQQVTVRGRNSEVSVNSDQNASAIVIRGRNLDALSDDPGELQNELQALAGPAAGPDGGQIYIDGFTGGQIPPKSDILEVRVNQNPFSAEYDRIGYGRVEIITKPGSEKLHGSMSGFGIDSALDTANPLVPGQPPYYTYSAYGDVSGPLTRNSSYTFTLMRIERQNQSMVDALNPLNTGQKVYDASPAPIGVFSASGRLDYQLGERNTFSLSELYWRTSQDGTGVGALSLPSQASNRVDQENDFRISDTMLVNASFVNDLRFQWRRIRSQQNPAFTTPAVILQGSFTSGGNSDGVVQDHQDNFEMQDKSTATAGRHTFRFGTELRVYRDANYSTSGSNGTYLFADVSDYAAGTPALYSATIISNPLVHAILVDGAAYFQDDWKPTPNFVLGTGLRYEGQNWIQDHNDWAPRLAMAWSPRHSGAAPAKTVIRAGYGWFYTRFTVPSVFSAFGGTPYAIEVLHDNLVNQQSYAVDHPSFYNPNAVEPPAVVTSAPSSTPSYHTIDPHFHAALDMQTGVGVDRQLGKDILANVTYLYTQGVHQYFSNNVTAPAFDPKTYTVSGAPPAVFNYQFQSGGVFKQSQIITTVNASWKNLTGSMNYTYNTAKSDTQGATSFVSDSQDPGLDYGRASFGIRHQFALLGSYSAPHGVTLAGAFQAQSGIPYNLTIGSDLTDNNQFNARPTYGTCGNQGVIATQYGCLDTDPAGKDERIVPFGAGIGPANSLVFLRLSKVLGIGPRLQNTSSSGSNTMETGSNVSDRGLSGSGATIHMDAAAPRRYSLTLAAAAINVFNHVNLGTPNGVLLSPLFNQTQSLAGGDYASWTPGNRTVYLQSTISF